MQNRTEITDKVSFFFIMNTWIGGGTERVFENIISCLKNSFPNSRIFLFLIDRVDIKLYKLPSGVIIINDVIKLLKEKELNKQPVVINFSGYWKSGFVSFLIFHKYISWCHNNPDILRKAKTGILNFFFLKRSQEIVCVCKEQIDILKNKYNFKNRISLIYNVVDANDIKRKSNEILVEVEKGRYFLMSARFELKQKDFLTLIKAYDLLHYDIKANYKLVLLGNGPDENKIRCCIEELGLSQYVILPGYDHNPYRWMKNAVANILCSNYEGFSVVVIEAMLCESPVILTEYHTGSNEISDSGKNAILIPIGDPKSLSVAMQKIVADSNFSKSLVCSAIKYVNSNFSEAQYQSKIESLFIKIIRDK
jgi:glycosyltransferase involved in cell wall biosynthesis